MVRDKSVSTTQRCALLKLLHDREVLSPIRLRLFELMENMTDEEKEAYAKETIEKILSGEISLKE